MDRIAPEDLLASFRLVDPEERCCTSARWNEVAPVRDGTMLRQRNCQHHFVWLIDPNRGNLWINCLRDGLILTSPWCPLLAQTAEIILGLILTSSWCPLLAQTADNVRDSPSFILACSFTSSKVDVVGRSILGSGLS